MTEVFGDVRPALDRGLLHAVSTRLTHCCCQARIPLHKCVMTSANCAYLAKAVAFPRLNQVVFLNHWRRSKEQALTVGVHVGEHILPKVHGPVTCIQHAGATLFHCILSYIVSWQLYILNATLHVYGQLPIYEHFRNFTISRSMLKR